jgi:hypothetical protein
VAHFDCLGDLGDPVGAARHVRRALNADGTWLIVEPQAGDRLEDNFNPVGRLSYGASTLICTPHALSEGNESALGGMLEPLLDIAVASAGTRTARKVGLLVVDCKSTGPEAMSQLADHVRTVCANRPVVRFAETQLAVLLIGMDEAKGRTEALDLVTAAHATGLTVSSGYASLAAGELAAQLIAAAEADLASAGPNTLIG